MLNSMEKSGLYSERDSSCTEQSICLKTDLDRFFLSSKKKKIRNIMLIKKVR
jgi:hypothetical protein